MVPGRKRVSTAFQKHPSEQLGGWVKDLIYGLLVGDAARGEPVWPSGKALGR